MKTAKITAYKKGKPWNGANGTIYYHYISLDNGDTGSIGTKDEAGAKVQVGCELTYTIDIQDAGNKIKAVKPLPAQGGNDEARQLMIVRQSSLKCAIDYYNLFDKSNEPISPKDITSLADEFTNWVMKG